MRVIGYIRVSTEEQAREGISLAAQEAKLRQYAALYDLELIEVVIDAGQSAKSLRRPGLQQALQALEQGRAEGLLIPKLDRLTRSVRDLGSLLEGYFEKRFALLSVADQIDTRTVGGRLVLNILASVSQWERESVGERTRTALQHLKSQGVKLGAPALQGVAVARIRELATREMTLREIARTMESEGHPTLKGGRWAPETVRKVLARAAV